MPRNLNPLYTALLEEWKREMEEKNPESHIVTAIGKAIASLGKSMQVYLTPRDCGELKWFGPKILTTLEKRLDAHRSGGDPKTSAKGKRKAPPTGDDTVVKKRGRPSKKSVVDDESDAAPSVVPIPRAMPRPRTMAGGAHTQIQVEELEQNDWDPYNMPARGINVNGPRQVIPQRASADIIDQPFLFWYIDCDQKRVLHRDNASVQIRNDCEIWYTIEYPSDQAAHPFIRRLSDIRPAPSGHSMDGRRNTNNITTMLACMCKVDVQQREFSNAPRDLPVLDVKPVPPKTAAKAIPRPTSFQSKPLASTSSSNLLTMDDLKAEQDEARKRTTLDPSRQRSFVALKAQAESTLSNSAGPSSATPRTKSAPVARPMPRTSTVPSTSSFASSSSSPPPPTRTIPRTMSAPVATSSRIRGKAPRVSAHIPTPAVMNEALEDELDLAAGKTVHIRGGENQYSQPRGQFQLPFKPIIFPPHSYTISLVLDTREVKNHKDRDFIGRELKKRGINVITRALELGDVCWVAKRHDGVDAGTGLDEASLDFILERKRVDDLIGSIKDTRFHEQKFRLVQSAITRVYYLVEEYSSDYVHKSMDKAVFTALSSAQIVEGFFLKETRDLMDTIEYLVGLHSAILDLHKNTALYIIPPDAIRRHSYVALQKQLRHNRPDVSYITTYSSFRELNKTGATSLREVFARMLLCINGMSAEKVSVVIETYDTPFSLHLAFKNAEERERRELALEASTSECPVGTKGAGRKKRSTVVPARLMLTKLEGKGRRHIGDAIPSTLGMRPPSTNFVLDLYLG